MKKVTLYLVCALTLWAGMASSGGLEPDPLTLRVQDASAPPGGLVAVVLRTYATRPIRQGQICMAVRLFRGKNASVGKATVPVTATSMIRGPSAGPFESMEGAIVFSDAGDATETTLFSPADAGQPTMIEFASISATVNASDGPLLVLYYRLRPDVVPGESYELAIDLANTVVLDADDQPIQLEARNAELLIRAASDPIAVSAATEETEKPTVILSMQTQEPIPISSGQVGFRYSRDLLPWIPEIINDSRYGNAVSNLVHIRGLVVIQFSSPDNSLNTVPGDILNLALEINPMADPTVDRTVWLDPAYTFLYDSEGTALPLALETDTIP